MMPARVDGGMAHTLPSLRRAVPGDARCEHRLRGGQTKTMRLGLPVTRDRPQELHRSHLFYAGGKCRSP